MVARLVLAIAASNGWFFRQTDFRYTFPLENLKDEIYMTPISGLFSLPSLDVCKLKWSLYDFEIGSTCLV